MKIPGTHRARLAAAALSLVACSEGGSGGARPDDGDLCVRAPGGRAAASHVYRFEGATPPLTVQLLRRFVDHGAGESSLYALDGFAITRDGACASVRTSAGPAAELTYENTTHHNWADVASATVDGIRYKLQMQRGLSEHEPGAWMFTLTGTSSGGAVVVGPATLRQTGGLPGWVNPPVVPLLVSELGPQPGAAFRDEAGEEEPWIEIYNPGGEAIDIGGYTLSNDPSRPDAWAFPPGTKVGRHQRLVVVADGEPAEGPLHASFRLAPTGGHVRLSAPDGTSYGERAYPAVTRGSLVYAVASDTFRPSATPTPGADEPQGGPSVFP